LIKNKLLQVKRLLNDLIHLVKIKHAKTEIKIKKIRSIGNKTDLVDFSRFFQDLIVKLAHLFKAGTIRIEIIATSLAGPYANRFHAPAT